MMPDILHIFSVKRVGAEAAQTAGVDPLVSSVSAGLLTSEQRSHLELTLV